MTCEPSNGRPTVKRVGEFELIHRLFRQRAIQRADVITGIGDDAAVLQIEPDEQLLCAVDTLVEGVHFPHAMPARQVGHRALAVNLSDIAAMGGRARWVLLALTLPTADDAWLEEFAEGFHALAATHGVALVGGDMTAGPLTISVTVMGSVAQGHALQRSGAQAGDVIFVSGNPGAARLGLDAMLEGDDSPSTETLRQRFNYPQPRLALGTAMAPYAHAMIDVSDGLLADLGHILEESRFGARLNAEALPILPDAVAFAGRDRALIAAATGGDDYELLFTVPVSAAALAEDAALRIDCPITRIGIITAGTELVVEGEGAALLRGLPRGYQHF
ncbi:MAG: thiamine-phosphate kinase [Gammaproteobacteria bacterium]|nr:thiamine-phosphate kinase [Gammaproteobacteria bacterium]